MRTRKILTTGDGLFSQIIVSRTTYDKYLHFLNIIPFSPIFLPGKSLCYNFAVITVFTDVYDIKASMNSKLSAPVLILNANYEPLNVCTTKRALGLVISERASLILNGRGVIRTVSSSFPCPSIIRLIQMIKRPRPQIKLSKQEIFRRDNFTCQYCGSRGVRLTLDHQVPRRLGGKHTWDNLVTACAICNHKKGGRTPEQASMKIGKRPFAPKATAKYVFGRYLKQNQEWGEYIKGW